MTSRAIIQRRIEMRRSESVLMERRDWQCLAMGGLGGLAPYVCQVMASFLPHLAKPSAELESRASQILPQTLGQFLLTMGVLSILFVIASGVAHFNTDRSSNSRMREAFIAGIAVPGLILSFAQGLAIGADPARPPSPPSVAAPQAVSLAHFVQDQRLAQNAASSVDVAVDLRCDECPRGMNLSSLLRFVAVSQTSAGQPTSTALRQLGEVPPGQSQSFRVEGLSGPTTVRIAVPDYQQASSPNPQIWNSERSEDVVIRQGERIRLVISLRPGVWNTLRGALGRYAYYVIVSIRLVPERVPA